MKEFMMIFMGKNYEDLGLSPEEMQAIRKRHGTEELNAE